MKLGAPFYTKPQCGCGKIEQRGMVRKNTLARWSVYLYYRLIIVFSSWDHFADRYGLAFKRPFSVLCADSLRWLYLSRRLLPAKTLFLQRNIVYTGFDKPAEGESFGKKYCKAADSGKTGFWPLIAYNYHKVNHEIRGGVVAFKQ